ncbi:MAG: hypothetical protein H0T93_09865 [Chloroflexia bacterium]|nr:hypothetical protein [Chloroflexia bacterium]
MAVAFVRDIPGVAPEVYDAIVAQMGLDEEPPVGLIVHAAGSFGENTWREIEVWDSREAWETFYRDRIVPAVVRVLVESVLDGPPPPEPEYMDVHDLIQ